MKSITVNSKKQGLHQIIVDDDDYDFLSQWKWNIHKDKNRTAYYVIRTCCIGGRKTIHMHRLIMNALPKEIVDHINHNGLDNRKCNLRKCSHLNNSRNRSSARNSTSKYLGVYYKKPYDGRRGSFKATIKTGNKNTNLGSFQNEKEAAFKYNQAALKFHGQFANINILNRD